MKLFWYRHQYLFWPQCKTVYSTPNTPTKNQVNWRTQVKLTKRNPTWKLVSGTFWWTCTSQGLDRTENINTKQPVILDRRYRGVFVRDHNMRVLSRNNEKRLLLPNHSILIGNVKAKSWRLNRLKSLTSSNIDNSVWWFPVCVY